MSFQITPSLNVNMISDDSWPLAPTSCRHFVALLDTFYWSDTNTLGHFAFRRERTRAK